MSNLKPFDLSRWKAGDEIMYRDGKEVLDAHYFGHKVVKFPLLALAWDGSFTSHLPDGGFDRWGSEHPRDVVMKPKKVKWYFASWKINSQGIRHTSNLFLDKEILASRADITRCMDPLIHQIEIEE